MPLLTELSDLRGRLQDDLFPHLEEILGPLSGSYRLIVAVFEMAPVPAFLTPYRGGRGRPPADRVPLARSFIAKAVLNLATTSHLIERLTYDKTLRRLCGWNRVRALPSEAGLSNLCSAECHLHARRHHDFAGGSQRV